MSLLSITLTNLKLDFNFYTEQSLDIFFRLQTKLLHTLLNELPVGFLHVFGQKRGADNRPPLLVMALKFIKDVACANLSRIARG